MGNKKKKTTISLPKEDDRLKIMASSHRGGVDLPGVADDPRRKHLKCISIPCPHCKRKYTTLLVKRNGKKITRHCPFCRRRVEDTGLSLDIPKIPPP
jgi:transcription elongation factor Elf1